MHRERFELADPFFGRELSIVPVGQSLMHEVGGRTFCQHVAIMPLQLNVMWARLTRHNHGSVKQATGIGVFQITFVDRLF